MKILAIVGMLLSLRALSESLLFASATYELFSQGATGNPFGLPQLPFLFALNMFALNLGLAIGYGFFLLRGTVRFFGFAACHLLVYSGLAAVILMTEKVGAPGHPYTDPSWVPDEKFLLQLLASLSTHVLTALLSGGMMIFLWVRTRRNEPKGAA